MNADVIASPAPLARPAAPKWIGRVLSGVAVLFLSFDAAVHLAHPAFAVEATAKLGFSPDVLVPLGLIQLAFVALYLVRRTSPLGAVLWTGYLGGAVAAHVRAGDPLFSHALFPVYVAALVWGGLFLRDPRVRALLK